MCYRLSKNRGGFTLVELLVVIGIVGTIVALLLPAVQKIREAANNLSCKNNLKQMGLAIQSYHDSFRRFPTGGTTPWAGIYYDASGQPQVPPNQGAGWGFQILPFVEQNALYGQEKPYAGNTPLRLYSCPSRRPPTICPTTGRALTDYASVTPANAPGSWDQYWYGAVGPPPDLNFYGWDDTTLPGMGVLLIYDYRAPPPQPYNGVIIRTAVNRFTNFASITDGTSETMVVTEKRLHPSKYLTGDLPDDAGWSEGWDPDTVRYTGFPPAHDSDGADSQSWQFWYQVGSAHPTTFNALFADGSVHTLSFGIDLAVFNDLGDRRDGRVFSLDD